MLPLACTLLALAGPAVVSAQSPTTDMRRSSGVIELGGTMCPYLLEGTGIPCVVVGPAFFYSQFFSDYLRQHVQFVLVDFKNSWRAESTVEVSGLTISDLVEEIDEVRRALGFEKICVLGASVLGFWPLEYARVHADRASHAIMIGTPPYHPFEYEDFWEHDASAERKQVLERNWEEVPWDAIWALEREDRFPAWFKNMAPRFWYEPDYDPYWHLAGREAFEHFKDHVFEVLVADYDPRGSFPEIVAPVFLALGRYDYMVPYTLWDDARELLPNLSYNLFEKSGHFPMLEEQELFDRTLIEWLERSSRGPSE